MSKETDILNDNRVGELLKRNSLSVTDSRKKILQLFVEQAGALAHGDIEKRAGEKFDRVTVYRTLQTFVDKGIIHTIPTADNSIRYALCKDECSEGHHHDHHIHFVCNNCHNTYCLDDVVTPEIKLPKGYTAEHVEVVVEGICKNCK
ncbi:MAG: transcriptional repressor [Chitinophagaceae bacterium]|jgi:Fur family ferric uptake transcriptional regulator|nr:transcriptional repressor [Chitinophagaceae bacterium]MBK7677964.1 transcriptional repressor [Chitinophagaceae bacterium]MBK9658391.1 transcriptional repressor [Chitinophagaceae bacterium]MBK9938494.1 transcriptional repressor [Chitinophagaceae bacterium]MBL0069111.1 transcriptional repressor [Chitinophagaceae bacterium]